jgi:hypothetical protein
MAGVLYAVSHAGPFVLAGALIFAACLMALGLPKDNSVQNANARPAPNDLPPVG